MNGWMKNINTYDKNIKTGSDWTFVKLDMEIGKPTINPAPEQNINQQS
jgi:hypothetical protein